MILSSKFALSTAATLAVMIFPWLPVPCVAQATSNTTTKPQSVAKTLTIDTAQVAYVSGDDVVLKLPSGALRLFELPAGTSLTVDGKPAKPADLQPGMTVSHVQLRSRTESDVTEVTQINGRITARTARTLTLRLDDGTSKIYRVPMHATFTVDGQTRQFADLTTGMNISVTAVKTSGLSNESSRAAMVAQTPAQSGTLVIEK